jgi:uncharacterized protein YbjT (DUF2867 family)
MRGLSILVTGATGYLGRALVEQGRQRGHRISTFIRPGSEQRLPPGTPATVGDPFSADSLAEALSPGDTLVHLIGTPRPNPRKAQEFLAVDLRSAQVAAAAAVQASAAHIVYVSVAHPAPVMQAYIEARSAAEGAFRATGIPTTVLRPWYVLGPGHWWPYLLVPLYEIFKRVPSKRETALRLGLVTHQQMIAALLRAIEDGPEGFRVIDVPAIRNATGRSGDRR